MLKSMMSDSAIYRTSLAQVDALPRCYARYCADEPQGEVPGLEQLDEFVADLAGRPDLKLETLEDGCFARSQVICGELRDRGFNRAKVFAQSVFQSLRASDDDEQVKWNYHVAPVVLARVGDQVEPRVVDPQASDRTLSLQDWLGGFRQRQHVVVTVHEDTKYQNGVLGSRDFEKNLVRAERFLAAL